MSVDWEFQLEWEDILEDFGIWVVTFQPSCRFVSYKSAGKYVSSVRAWYHRFYRARLGLGAEGGRINEILKGYARCVDQPPPREREGCTPADLRRGIDVCYGDGSAESQMWRAALTYGMGSLSRWVEFALDSGRREQFESSQHITPGDVRFFDLQGRRHARVRMRKRKDLRVLRGKHGTVLLAGGGSVFDPVAELEAWTQVRATLGLSQSGPLFCHADGSSITVDEVRDAVRRCMTAAGRDPALFGAHSLRIGGATAALAAGVSPQLIRLMGRWSSDVYEIYCRMSVQAALGVGVSISSATVIPTARAFHEEHFELLGEEVGDFRRQLGPAGPGDLDDLGSDEDAG